MKHTHPDAPRGSRLPVTRACRLLPFLLEHCTGKSRNNIKSMLSRGQILVDGRPVTRFDHALTAGQTVTVLAHVSPRPALPFDILYEDDELIVIDKPAGLLSIATDREQTATAYRTLNDYVSGKKPGSRVHVVHRLDRDTSGILLFAKNRALKLAFQNDWNKLARTRGYVAVAEGVPQRPAGTIRSFLYETSTRIVYSGAPGAGGQEAITRYALRAENGRYSLLDVEIDTGRKNQIRVHLKELGHPVAGDKKYGASSDPLGRLGLHAGKLVLVHPFTGRELLFTCAMPAAFDRLFCL